MKELKSKWLFSVHFFWSSLTLVLGLWWGSVILAQARQIALLESELGREAAGAAFLAKTQNMIGWEAAAYLLLILFSTVALFRLFSRDQKRVRALQSFFASFTHELKTPLASIRLQTEAIAGAKDPAPLVTRLLEDTARLEHQVERSLELARVESGGKLFVEPVSLVSFLTRALPRLHPHGSRDLEIEGLESLPETTVCADPHALQVIFKNLIENGMKYGRNSPSEPYRLNVTLTDSDADKKATLILRDRGPGTETPAQQLGQLFARGKGHAAATGTGVGLYLVKVLMQQMGGDAEFGAANGFQIRLTFRKGVAHE